MRRFDVVVNADPEREYRWANPNDDHFGLAALVADGWDIEHEREGGPRSAVPRIKSEGGYVTQQGMVLVSRLRADYAAYGSGIDTAASKAATDALEKQVIRKRIADDHMRGGAGLEIKNETSGTFYDYGR